MSRIRILVAEDDPNIRNGIVDTLESEGYRGDAAGDGPDFIESARADGYRSNPNPSKCLA